MSPERRKIYIRRVTLRNSETREVLVETQIAVNSQGELISTKPYFKKRGEELKFKYKRRKKK